MTVEEVIINRLTEIFAMCEIKEYMFEDALIDSHKWIEYWFETSGCIPDPHDEASIQAALVFVLGKLPKGLKEVLKRRFLRGKAYLRWGKSEDNIMVTDFPLEDSQVLRLFLLNEEIHKEDSHVQAILVRAQRHVERNTATANDIEPDELITDTKIEQAIRELMNATSEGKEVFCEKQQWYAVYRVLSKYCGFPAMMTKFIERAKELGWDKLGPDITEDTMKKATQPNTKKSSTCCTELARDLCEWKALEGRADNKTRKQIAVAKKLCETLGLDFYDLPLHR